MSFNLLEEQWIPVVRTNGKTEKVGIRRALAEAAAIREVHAPSPLDTVAVYRFLLAVLQWCNPDPTEEEVSSAREKCLFPGRWFTRLDDDAVRFELLGEERGFYQDRLAWVELENRGRTRGDGAGDMGRPATDLVAELPSGSNVAHFRHTRDGRDGLCPACCAVGLIRLSAFATHSAHPPYPGGKPSGINGGTPVYAVPIGPTLMRTLLLNWPMPTKQHDRPGWMSDLPIPATDIGCLAAFTWRPRRVWLQRPSKEAPAEKCTYCGDEHYQVIRRMAFLPGWPRPFGKDVWADDPHLLILTVEPKAKRARQKTTPVSFPAPSHPADWHARIWRRVYRAILQAVIPDLVGEPPTQHRHLLQCLRKADGRHSVKVGCFGPAANQALYQDATSLTLRLPMTGVGSEHAKQALEELTYLDGLDLRDALRAALPRQADKRPEIAATLAGESVQVERRLRQHFECLIEALASSAPNAVDDWRKHAHQCLAAVLRETCKVLGRGSALRRGEQQGTASGEFGYTVASVSKRGQRTVRRRRPLS